MLKVEHSSVIRTIKHVPLNAHECRTEHSPQLVEQVDNYCVMWETVLCTDYALTAMKTHNNEIRIILMNPFS